jgi:glycosyltransferase involved in cell wall biosynthesis
MIMQPITSDIASSRGTRLKPPLSIAIMIESVLLGGAEMVVLQLATELRDRGHTVHPVVPLGDLGWLGKVLREHGFDIHTYDLRRPIDFGLPARLAATLAKLNVEVVHSHEFTMAVYGTAATRRLRIPHIITMHGNQIVMDRFRRRVALRWALRRSQAAIAVSQDTGLHMESRLGLRKGEIRVIPNGIPHRPGDPRKLRSELGIDESEVLLVSVGNLSPRKSHVTLVEALARLRQQRGDEGLPWRLVIVGEGPERPKLEQMIREAGLEQRVHLVGGRTDIPDIQAAADVFVLPSLWEGLPLVILEAMISGNPVIASNVSGIPEAVEHGKHGLLTPPGDAGALADAIGTVLRDPDYRRQLGEAALAHACSHFTIDIMTSAYEDLYRSFL